MQNNGLIQQSTLLTRQLLSRAAEHFDIDLACRDIRFDLRGRAAGMVVFPRVGNPYIRYNRLLLEENGEAFLSQTLPHEVAHLVAYVMHGRSIRPHGREWKAVMDFFGADAVRCHNFSLDNHALKKLRRFAYVCKCRRHQLTSIRHNRILKGQSYLCRRCGEELSEVRE